MKIVISQLNEGVLRRDVASPTNIECVINSLVPGGCGSYASSIIFKVAIQNSSLGTGIEIFLMRMPKNPTDKISTLVQVMAWWHKEQALAWANVELEIYHHMASLGHNGLRAPPHTRLQIY